MLGRQEGDAGGGREPVGVDVVEPVAAQAKAERQAERDHGQVLELDLAAVPAAQQLGDRRQAGTWPRDQRGDRVAQRVEREQSVPLDVRGDAGEAPRGLGRRGREHGDPLEVRAQRAQLGVKVRLLPAERVFRGDQRKLHRPTSTRSRRLGGQGNQRQRGQGNGEARGGEPGAWHRHGRRRSRAAGLGLCPPLGEPPGYLCALHRYGAAVGWGFTLALSRGSRRSGGTLLHCGGDRAWR